jgi:hydroxypyruvate isomerase
MVEYRFSANTGFLWKDRPFLQRIRAAAASGFDAVEFHDELHGATYTWSSADLRDGLFVRLDGHRSHVFAPRPVL